MMTTKNLATTLVLAAAGTQLGATDCGQITRDPGFDLWCGDQLCAWKLERGDIARVPTWNEGDPGVELVGDDVAIEQLTPVTSGDGTCIEFDLIANVEQNAQATLNIDIDGDGTIEQSEQLPTSNWKPLSFLISIKPPYSGVRFELAKRGSGRAVLAQINAKISTQCGDIGTIAQASAPDGEPCVVDSDCASGKCRQAPFEAAFLAAGTMVCEGCEDGNCAGSDVCGAGAPMSPVRAVAAECVAPASAELGEQCVTGAECASGICNQSYCSTCDATHACGSGETCGSAWPVGNDWFATAPTECDPNAAQRAAGEPCMNAADCKSGACTGAPRMQCDDGRECANNTDCPFGTGSNGALANGACATVGVQGGVCQ